MASRHLILTASFTTSFLCNALLQASPRTPTPVPASASATARPTAVPAPTPSYVPEACSNGILPTVAPDARLVEPTPVGGTDPPIDTEVQLSVLDGLVEAVEEVYVYPDYNGVDWPDLASQARGRVENGLDTEAFYEEMRDLVTDLGDDHSHFLSPREVAEDEADLAGENDYVGIGVLVDPLPEFGRVSILVVFPDSPAEREGLRAHDSILAVDGSPIAEGDQVHPEWVRGPECTLVILTVQTPGEAPRDMAFVRVRVRSPLPIDSALVPTDDGRRVGYIFLPTFFDETIPDQVEAALHALAPLEGLILDNRMNSGGSSRVVERILAFFTDGILGEFVSREARRPLRVTAQEVENSQTVPLVVLIGENTVSFGEIMSGVLSDVSRARLVGETTGGNVEVLHGYDFEDGSTAWIAEETFDPLRSDQDWERDGIVPEVFAAGQWHTFTLETDPAVEASLLLLSGE